METVKNKKAFFDYEILEKFEAGIVLTGGEVKSIKSGQASLRGAYVTEMNGKLHLTGAHVSAYQPANQTDHNPTRPRPLLLKSKELKYLRGKLKEKGLTLIPLRMYTKRSLVKLEIGLAKGKKKYDKRQQIKRREDDRRIRRSLKGDQ